MLVLQISPYRMGSTWQFNTARELLLLQSPPVVSSYLSFEGGFGDSMERKTVNFLFKTHSLDLEKFVDLSAGLDVKVLISCRNLFDTIKSSRRVFSGQADEVTLNSIHSSLADILQIIEYGFPYHLSVMDDLNSEHELIVETQEIARFLNLEVSSDSISEVALKLTKESIRSFIMNSLNLEGDFKKWDENTQWHGSHISPLTKETDAQGQDFPSEKGNAEDLDSNLSRVQNLQFEISKIIDLVLPVTQQRDELTQQRDELVNSTIWRVTNPIRKLINFLKFAEVSKSFSLKLFEQKKSGDEEI